MRDRSKPEPAAETGRRPEAPPDTDRPAGRFDRPVMGGGIPGLVSDHHAHRLYVHLAWSTLANVSALEPARRSAIETHVLASCCWFGADPVEVCALADRVHLLVRLPAVLSVHDFARRVRTDVERFLADSGRVIRWAPGYAAVTVAPRDVRRVRRRIASLGWPSDPSGATRPGRPRHVAPPTKPRRRSG